MASEQEQIKQLKKELRRATAEVRNKREIQEALREDKERQENLNLIAEVNRKVTEEQHNLEIKILQDENARLQQENGELKNTVKELNEKFKQRMEVISSGGRSCPHCGKPFGGLIVAKFLIGCGHSFCSSCLETRNTDGRITCLICNKPTVVATADLLPTNYAIMR